MIRALVFRCFLYPNIEASSLSVQLSRPWAGLCLIWSETLKTGYFVLFCFDLF